MSSIPREHLSKITAERTKILIQDLLKDPLDFPNLLERCAAGISATIAWNDSDPATAKNAITNTIGLLAGISPESIENKIPSLESVPEWIPGFLQPWRVEEKRRKELEREFWFGQQAECKANIKEKEKAGAFSWTRESLKDESLNEEEKAYTIGMLSLIAGVLESAPIQGLFIALARFPEWQKRGQEEVDAVCGQRMPCIEDIQRLPVVRALIREVFRWRSPVPFGALQVFCLGMVC